MKCRGLGAVLVLLLLPPVPATAGNFRSETREVAVELVSEPRQPIQGRETVYMLLLRDGAGQPLAGAKVTLMGRMADGMTVLVPLRATSEFGIYSGRALFTMAGEWQLTLRIALTGKPLELSFTEQVGRSEHLR